MAFGVITRQETSCCFITLKIRLLKWAQQVLSRAVSTLVGAVDNLKNGRMNGKILEETGATSGPDDFRGINRFERYAEMEKEFLSDTPTWPLK